MLIAVRLAGAPALPLGDAIVALVDRVPITATMLDAYRARFAGREVASAALLSMIDDVLIAREARRYALTLAPDELPRALSTYPAPPGFEAAEWSAIVGDHLLASHLLAFRFGEYTPLSREQLQAHFKAHRDRFPGSFESQEDRVREVLAPLVRAKREADMRADLRQRADVVVFPDRVREGD